MLGVTHPHTHMATYTHRHTHMVAPIIPSPGQTLSFSLSFDLLLGFHHFSLCSLWSFFLRLPDVSVCCVSYMHSLSMHSQIHSDSVIFPAGRITFEAKDRGIKARSSHLDGIQSVTSKHWNTPGLGEFCTNHNRLRRFVTADTNALIVCFKVFFIIRRNLLEIIEQTAENRD